MLLGLVLILTALRDIGQELFKPAASGRLSRAVSRVIWRLFRLSARRRPSALLLSGPEMGRSPGDAETLERLAEAVMIVEGDLERFPVTWYFHEAVPREALPVMIPTLLRWATRSLDASEPRLRRQAAVAKAAVDGLASSLSERGFIPQGSTQETLAAWAAAHCHDAPGEADG